MSDVAAGRRSNPIGLLHYDYALPPERIAQEPLTKRDHSKLLVLNRKTGRTLHRRFDQIEKYFSPGDLLVVNDSRVMPSRLFGHKPTGGKVEILLLQEDAPGQWKGLVRGIRWEDACTVTVAENVPAHVHAGGHAGVRRIDFDRPAVAELMEAAGHIPLPPYIKQETKQAGRDRIRYQTTYADRPGSAAAPTAGLHFTPDLLDALRDRGVLVVPITLHVGYGTFQLIEEQDISAHTLHSEYYRISRIAARSINESRARGGKVFAVGTTVVRTLEHASDSRGIVAAGSGWNDCYIWGDYKFKAVDHLITNFHWPKSSLLVLASAFAGRERLLRAYGEAVENEYRFFSYGDAMLIL